MTDLFRSKKFYKPKSFHRAKAVTRELIVLGIFPGPTAINRALGRSGRRMNQINGVESRARREAMREAGFKKNLNNDRWEPPVSWKPRNKENQ